MKNTDVGKFNEQTLSNLEDVVGYIAAAWRETKDDGLVGKYHLLVNCLIDMGWKTGLDPEDQLPPS
jgi:hypothetical protein